MRTICFYFQVHQPFRLKKYRFFEIGNDHYYYDDFSNRSIMKKVAEKCYLPMNHLLLDLIKEYGSGFKVSFSISGVAMEQFEKYAPEVLDSFKALAKTGNVEFLAETYSHSLSSLKSKEEFARQIELHVAKVKEHFGQTPTVFRNTELVYSDEIGNAIADLGYDAMLTEGARQILGWKSPNYLYFNAINKKLKVLLKNYKLSDDIAFRFSNHAWAEWPLTTEKFVNWLNQIPENEEVVNLFMDYETFGEHQWADTGIFNFMRALPNAVFKNSDFKFLTPSEVAKKLQPVAAVNVPYPISWADEERDLTAWLGNEMQDEAFDKIYELEGLMKKVDDPDLQKDWLYLQTSDHFYYMCTKFFSDGDVHRYFNPYENPYNAFINYMNVLSDFIIRIEKHVKTSFDDNEPVTKKEITDLLRKYQAEIDRLKVKMEKLEVAEKKPVAKKATVKKTGNAVKKVVAEKKKTDTTKKTTADKTLKTNTTKKKDK
ncbi:MAG: glycoside hydrolase family 57 protein [Bacteroidales bacterium]|nr:glycoside hydrolase family 57 protein [Bacteroidales bacterium]